LGSYASCGIRVGEKYKSKAGDCQLLRLVSPEILRMAQARSHGRMYKSLPG
jgi:hypothetical protein